MKNLLMVTLVGVSVQVSAGSLLKQMVADGAGTKALPLTKMSRAGLDETEKMKSAMRYVAPEERYSGSGDTKMGYLMTEDHGKTGVIQSLFADNQGQITRTSMNIPEALLKPQQVRISTSSSGALVEREFDLVSGKVQIQQTMHVTEVKGVYYRSVSRSTVKTDKLDGMFSIDSGEVHVYMTAKDSAGKSSQLQTIVPKQELGGDVIAGAISASGNRLTLHIVQGPNVLEVNYALAPSIVERGTLQRGPAQIRVLSKAEVKSMGLIAEVKTIPGRVSVDKPVKNMDVEIAPGNK